MAYDRVKQATRLESERPHALRQAILACRSGGIVSVIGVYGGFIDKFPTGAFMNRALTLRTGQCHVQRYMQPLLRAHRARRDRPDAGSSRTRCRCSRRRRATTSSSTSRTAARRSCSSPEPPFPETGKQADRQAGTRGVDADEADL